MVYFSGLRYPLRWHLKAAAIQCADLNSDNIQYCPPDNQQCSDVVYL